jgi:AcrR family transcriptional regulator
VIKALEKSAFLTRAATSSRRGGTPEDQRVRAAATRAGLIDAARALFAERGFHATGTNDLVAAARVTRGALYHHFADKQDLFEAVFRQVLEELNRTARASVASLSGDTWAQLTIAQKKYLEIVASSREVQQIVLIDGPAVLGWRRWRELHSEWIEAGLTETLGMLMARGAVAPGDPAPLSALLQAALNDAALSIAYAADPRVASASVTAALMRILDGLRVR